MQSRIDIDKLLQPRQKIARQRNKTYGKILELAHRRIRYNVLQRPECDWCVFSIPLFVVGLPRFNVDTCTRYCLAKLRANGFDITFVPPYTILISWDKYVKISRRKARNARVRERRIARTGKSETIIKYNGGSRMGTGSTKGGELVERRQTYLDGPAPRASWSRVSPSRPPI